MTNSESRITLYGPPYAPYTEKVRRALALKGLEFEFREPSGPEDYERWSPETGLLPVLTIGEELVSDSTAILYRLDELFPEPRLLAAEPQKAAQQRRLEDWADESFLYYYLQWQRIQEKQSAPALEGDEPRRPSSFVRRLGTWLRAGGTWERPETALVRGLGDRLDDLVNFLGARPFFYASEPSVADLGVYGMLWTMRAGAMPNSTQLVASRPTLVEFMRRLEACTGG